MAFDIFLALIKAHGLPIPAREIVFAPPRKFRADYLWQSPRRIILEKEGGIWSRSARAQRAHAAPLTILRDMEKGNLAQSLGYLYLRYTPEQLERGDALPLLERLLFG